jgi:hypothetical protein
MATAHVLAIGGYREAPRLSNIPINVILDGVVRRVAFLRHEAPKAVADELLRGYYSGDLTGINNVRAALGRWGMYQLFGIDGTETGSDLNNLARTLDAPYIAENARALREGRSIKLYNW